MEYCDVDWMCRVLTMLVAVCGVWGQSSSTDPAQCTYSFVVPDTDVVGSCSSYTSRQVNMLTQTVEDLQNMVDRMSDNSGSSGSGSGDKSDYTCSCHANTTFSFTYRDCQDVKTLFGGPSGTYEIQPIKSTGQLIEVKRSAHTHDSLQRYWVTQTWGSINVPCDLTDDSIGWTVLMRRRSPYSLNFDRNWDEYKEGFGDISHSGEFWLGLENMHKITSQSTSRYSLWLVVVTSRGVPHVLSYGRFSIGNEDSYYAIQVDDYHGKLSNGLSTDRPFATKDKQKTVDMSTVSIYGNRYSSRTQQNCASTDDDLKGGGWWFDGSGVKLAFYFDAECGSTSLTAKAGPKWTGITDLKNYTMVEMKIRPINN